MKSLNNFLWGLLFLLSACAGGRLQQTKQIEKQQISLQLADSIQQAMDRGIDFIAYGNEPAHWKLSFNFEDSIRFSSVDGFSFVIPTLKPVQDNDGMKIYSAPHPIGKLEIQIFSEKCATGSTPDSRIRASVQAGNRLYTGCGQYLYDSRLNDKWRLVQYAGKTNFENTKNAAFLQFEIENQNLTGTDGCNRIQGKFWVQGNYIQFSNLSSTMKSCAQNDTENFYSRLSGQLIRYRLDGIKLYLYLIDDSILIFEKYN